MTTALVLCGCGGSGQQGGGQEAGDGRDDPIRDVGEISSSSDKASLVGRGVELEGVKVIEATGTGYGLVVGTEIENGVPVALSPTARRPGKGGAGEGTDVKMPGFESGQSVNISGRIRETPDNYDDALRDFDMKRKQFELVREDEVFILARSVEPA